MQNLPVHWSEGLFLTAQHFQAAERHAQELVFRSAQFDQAYYYGLKSVHFSVDAIANFSFQLSSMEARTRNGAVVAIGQGSEADRISLKEALAASQELARSGADKGPGDSGTGTIRVYLALPKLSLGIPNVGRRGEAGIYRFVEVPSISLPDENSGANDQEVPFRAFNASVIARPPVRDPSRPGLAASFRDDDPNFEFLPIAQIRGGGDKGPILDDSYIPPIVCCDAWPALGGKNGILQTIYEWIGARIETLSAQVIARQITLSSQEPGDLDRLLMLMRLNEAYTSLSIIAFAKGIHPWLAYWVLVQILGQLSIFGEQRRPPQIPPYDHDNLGYIFRWAMEQIRVYLDLERFQMPYFFRPFEGRGLGMQVTFDSAWMGAGFRWYVGVFYDSITASQCRGLLAPNALFWKLGSARQVEGLFQSGRPGLNLVPNEQAPKELPANNWIYFEVTRAGDAWADVVATQTLAMRYKDTLVDNRESLEGERTLVINVPPKKVKLEFGLFAIPSRS